MTKAAQTNNNTLNLSDQAMTFLGLSQQPFSAEILSSDAFFKDATLEQLIDTTKHHLQFSDLLLIIEGDFGSGKTTLFRQLLPYETDNLFLISVPALATHTLSQIQETISFNLKDQGDANHLDDNLKRLQTFDQTPVIIIDDAHVLSDTTLQELLRYQNTLLKEKNVKLKILMLANKGMAKTIEAISDLQHNQLFVQTMPSYTSSQIHDLLSHRLQTIHYQGDDYFDAHNINIILKKSDGTPLQIMQQAALQLETITKKNSDTPTLRTNTKQLSSIAALIILSGIALYFFMPTEETENSDSVLPNIIETESIEHEAISPEPSSETKPEQINQNSLEQNSMESETSAPDNEINIGITTADKITVDSVANTEIELDPENKPDLVNAMDSNINIDSSLQKNKEAIETSSLLNKVEPAITQQEEAKLTVNTENQNTPTEALPEKILEPVPEPVIDAIKTEPVIKKPVVTQIAPDTGLIELKASNLRDAGWLKQQAPSTWTLQVMGAREPSTLVKFISQNKLNAESAWYQTELSGKPWYVLVHRFYTDKDIARESIQHLPEALKNTKPWVKNLGSIQKSLTP